MTGSCDVAVVGLGPTGLTLAHLLGRRGLDVVVLEREPQFYGMARAVYTDDECMRVFQAARVADDVAKDMVIDSPVQWVHADGSVLGQFIQTSRPMGWPVLNFLYQPWLENTLEDLLDRYPNVTVRRGREVTDLAQDDDGVTLTHEASTRTGYGRAGAGTDAVTGEADHLRAAYVVGADGGRSMVRELLGIELTGTRFPDRWLVVDIRVKDDKQSFRHLPYFNFYCDPHLPTVSCPQPGGYHRFEFLLTADQTVEQMEDPLTVRAHLARHVDPDQVEVVRSLVYQFNALLAESWRDGRVLLAGDAAHMTPQFMGQGMSSGIRDAANLEWKLDAVLSHGADPHILDTYQSERAPHAKEMIDVSVLQRDFVSLSDPRKAKLRNLAVTTGLALPYVRDYLHEAKFKPKPAYRPGSYLGTPRRRRRGPEGRLMPQPTVRTYEGRHAKLDDLLGDGFAVLGIECDPTAYLRAPDREALERLGTPTLALFPLGGRQQGQRVATSRIDPAVTEVEDLDGTLLTWLRRAGVRPGDVVVVRPDKYVFAVVPAARIGTAATWLVSELGLRRPAALGRG